MQARRESKSGSIGRLYGLGFATAVIAIVAGCGSESTPDAAAGAAAQKQAEAPSAEAATGTPAVAPVAAASTAAKAAALPIEQGIYGDGERGSCVRARRAFFYDGTNYGYVSPVEPGWNDTAYFEINRIARVGPPVRGSNFYDYYRGYTLAWTTENAENDEDILGIKAEGNGRIRSLAVSSGPKGDVFSEETYQKCTFSQLSPQMQATIRAERPQLAGAATPSLPLAAASIKFPPIPKGYYAVGTSCVRAASAQAASDGPSSLARFDESALTWYDGGPEIRVFESLGNNRFRVRARSYGNGDDTKGTSADFVIRVTGASSFVTEPGSLLFDRQETFTHCPTNIVPKAVRGWFEG